MKIIENNPIQNTIEFIIELERADIEADLQKAARHLAEHLNIPGFRPGQAPYDMVCRQAGGEAKIYEEALDAIVRRTLPKIIIEKKLETTGRPDISIQKMVPPFGITYKAVVSLLPQVELGDISKIKAEAKETKVAPEEIDKLVDELRRLRVSEAAVERPIQKGDKAVIDFEIKKGGTVIEGGSASDYPLIIGDARFIAGFEDQLLGLKAGEDKAFELSFPAEYFAKDLAGQAAQFSVKVKQVFERSLPEFNDEFARGLGGYENATALRKQIEDNIRAEKEEEEKERFEMACMEELLKISKIGELPEPMIAEETEKMIHELEHSITERGGKFEDYLQSIKKTNEELVKDFHPKAEHRLRVSLVARAFGKEQDIKVEASEVEKEIELSRKAYQANPEAVKQFSSPDYQEYVRAVLTSRKIFETLADKARKR